MVAAKFSVLMRSASSSPAASLTKAVPPTISAFRETSDQDFDRDNDEKEKMGRKAVKLFFCLFSRLLLVQPGFEGDNTALKI